MRDQALTLGTGRRYPEPGTGSLHIEAPREAALRVDVQAVLDDEEARVGFTRSYRQLADRGIRVCLRPEHIGADNDEAGRWRDFCAVLGDFRRPGEHPAFCIHSHQLPLDRYRAEADRALGAGARYVQLDGLQMQPAAGRVRDRSAANWQAVWRARTAGNPLLPVYGGFARSSCPLLADEAAVDVLPASGLQVPAGAGILAVRADLAAFADDAGRVDERSLAAALEATLEAAEQYFDSDCWATRAQRQDAVANRRIAFIVTGIGDLVLRQGADPSSLACLRSLDELLAGMRQVLRDVSACRAREHGPLPSLDGYAALGAWFAGSHGETWQACFDAARRRSATRNRNLMAMSPYAVLPASGRADPRCMDLLPLIRHADTWSFAGRPPLDGWNINEFKHFHERARAVIRASQAPALIAAGV